ncbi:MAG: GNAT family protein [Mycobacteriales bacterium]
MRRRAPWRPVELRYGAVGVRPLRRGDARTWSESRLTNEAWLSPWESTVPGPPTSYASRHTPAAYSRMWRTLRHAAREGTHLPFAVTYEDRFVGQVTAGNIVRGSFNNCALGYWVDQRYAGRGIAPIAVALVTDYCFGAARLHRVEANVRPENLASRRVLEKLQFRAEGVQQRYLLIDGEYHDHIGYALTVEDAPGGVLARYLAQLPTT